jgi:hypothetical protein
MLSSGVLFVLFLAGCWLYCLTDATLTPAAQFRGLSKNAWIYIIAATFVVGALAWLVARRSSRTKSRVTRRGGRATLADADFTWEATGVAADAADAAIARHPASRSRRAPDGPGNSARGPDDDPEFLRQLDRRIHGTSADPGELACSRAPQHLPQAGFFASLSVFASLTGKSGTSAGRAAAGPDLVRGSGLVRGGMGQAALGVMVMGWPSSASICRRWFLIFLSLSVRAW